MGIYAHERNAVMFGRSPLIGLVIAVVFLTAGVRADEAGFKSLFNGKDLQGWKYQKGAWAVLDGTIHCTGTSKTKNWLIWKGGEPADFELRLQFKWVKGNSGVQVRSHETKPFYIRGYQVEVAQQAVMGLWHHSLAPAKYRSTLALAGQQVHISTDGKKTVKQLADAEKVKSAYKGKAWNDLVVIARGNKITQIINGVTFSEVTDEDKAHSYRKGLIALQDHGKGCLVAFKNIRLRIIDQK